jgi:hypothetical protein
LPMMMIHLVIFTGSVIQLRCFLLAIRFFWSAFGTAMHDEPYLG